MTHSIGIAVPAHAAHTCHIPMLLDCIELSKVKPSMVSISCSGMQSYCVPKGHTFDVLVTCTTERQNASRNRNIAASKLSTDLVSFIDVDDLPHPQRLGFVTAAFENPDIHALVHDYQQTRRHEIDREFFGTVYDRMDLLVGYVDTVFPDCLYPKNRERHISYHNAHITVRKSLLSEFHYDEDQRYNRIEDSIFTRALVSAGQKISLINNKLSMYFVP